MPTSGGTPGTTTTFNYGNSTINSVTNVLERVGTMAMPYVQTPIQNSNNAMYQVSQNIKKTAAVMALVAGDYNEKKAVESYRTMDKNQITDANSEYLATIGVHGSNTNNLHDIQRTITTYKPSTTSVASTTEDIIQKAKDEFTTDQINELCRTGHLDIIVRDDKGHIIERTTLTVNKEQFQKAITKEILEQKRLNPIIGATTKKEQLKAMNTMYHKGIDHMQNSDRLSAIYRVQNRGSAAVIKQVEKVDKQITHDIKALNRKANNNTLDHLLTQHQLNKKDTATAISLVNHNKNLSSKEKTELIQMINDKNELHGFIESGVINGGSIKNNANQKAYGKRIVANKILGTEMQQGTDTMKTTYKVGKVAYKATYALGRAATNAVGAVTLGVAKNTSKLVEKSVTKITGTTNTKTSSFFTRQNDKRKKNYADSKAKRNAKKNKNYKEYKINKKAIKIEDKFTRFDNTIIRNNARISSARASKNAKLETKLNKKNNRIQRKKDRLNRKNIRSDKFSKLKNKINERIDRVTVVITKPFKVIAKPFQFVSNLINTIKKALMKVILSFLGSFLLLEVILAVIAAILLMVGGITAGKKSDSTKVREQRAKQSAQMSQYGSQYYEIWNALKGLGFSDAATVGVIGNIIGESGGDYTLNDGVARGLFQMESSEWSQYEVWLDYHQKVDCVASQVEYVCGPDGPLNDSLAACTGGKYVYNYEIGNTTDSTKYNVWVKQKITYEEFISMESPDQIDDDVLLDYFTNQPETKVYYDRLTPDQQIAAKCIFVFGKAYERYNTGTKYADKFEKRVKPGLAVLNTLANFVVGDIVPIAYKQGPLEAARGTSGQCRTTAGASAFAMCGVRYTGKTHDIEYHNELMTPILFYDLRGGSAGGEISLAEQMNKVLNQCDNPDVLKVNSLLDVRGQDLYNRIIQGLNEGNLYITCWSCPAADGAKFIEGDDIAHQHHFICLYGFAEDGTISCTDSSDGSIKHITVDTLGKACRIIRGSVTKPCKWSDGSTGYGDAVEIIPTYKKSKLGTEIVAYAKTFIGNKYVWGGESLENGVDCSGFTMKLYEKYNITLPHSAAQQSKYGTSIPVQIDKLQAGDLLFYADAGGIEHVAMYDGHGQVVHASNSKPYPDGGIKTSTWNYRMPVKAIRLFDTDDTSDKQISTSYTDTTTPTIDDTSDDTDSDIEWDEDDEEDDEDDDDYENFDD